MMRGRRVSAPTAKQGTAPRQPLGVPMTDVDVEFYEPGDGDAPPKEHQKATVATAVAVTDSDPFAESVLESMASASSVPTNTKDAGIKAWDPLNELHPQVAERPDRPLPSDGIMWDVDKATKALKRHVTDDERPDARYGREYFTELLRRRLEQEANQVYKFAKLLDGNLQGRARSAQPFNSVWLSNSPGGAAVSMIFQNLLRDVTSGGAAVLASLVEPKEVLPDVLRKLKQGLTDAAGDEATKALGITTEAGRIAAAQAIEGTRERALQFAEHAVKISAAAKDLPDELAGSIVREVIGLGNAALASPAVGAGGSRAIHVSLADAPPPVPGGAAAPPAGSGDAGGGGGGAAPPVPPALPKGGNATFDRAKKALELAERQISNPEYQLYRIMTDNPTEAKLKAWDLLYFNGGRYVRPKTTASVSKDLEAFRVISKIIIDINSPKDDKNASDANALIATYQATENTGLLFIDDSARAAILRAYDIIRYTHGNQSVPLIAFITQEAVMSRFAEFVAWVYHSPPGAAMPRGSSVSGAARHDQNYYLLGRWLAACEYRNGILVPPGYDSFKVAERRAREKRISDYVERYGAYPTGDPSVDRARKLRTLGDVAAAREEAERRAVVFAHLSGGSV